MISFSVTSPLTRISLKRMAEGCLNGELLDMDVERDERDERRTGLLLGNGSDQEDGCLRISISPEREKRQEMDGRTGKKGKLES